MKPGNHQSSKQRCQDLCWKVRDSAQSVFALCINYVTNTVKAQKVNKDIQKRTVGFHNHSPLLAITARKIAFTAHQMCCQRFCKGHLCTNLMTFEAHQRSSLTAPLPPRPKAVKAVLLNCEFPCKGVSKVFL